MSAYPEGTVKIENYKTPCHAAAESGCYQTLKMLLDDIQSRWDSVKKQNKCRADYNKKVEVLREKNGKDHNNIIPIDTIKKDFTLEAEYSFYLKRINDMHS